ncbi:hypothetical protein A2833_01110 [Candidatus Azambacteria bacterium RIFCSPHIGHO2_01_FULL_44_55]|nr:MAG: hypothetical protein A3A18_02105 [Candidatus Azambacteria bacterium RIFCSPLOWO2_01_FULL_44_84]OGD40835.1 MAG: hypothetical protein A2833_01110 [Candidatus Azambacteria bacterium RIFCSPHIGHO2_01_FULL_44_55]OGD51944.1 MAG: hypothetical protein A2608_02300 [Candidatus Azambacteria bacterium RIFOXYD1_FULL_44_10]
MESIDPRKLLTIVAEILERLKIPYLITGGMAVFTWGRPRFTADIDIIVKLKIEDVNKLIRALGELHDTGYIDKDAARKAILCQGEFNFIDGDSGIKVDFWVLGNGEFNENQLKRRVIKKIDGRDIYFISPEDLILSKLLRHKESQSFKQLEDIESVLKIQKKLDLGYIKKWAKKQSTVKIFESLLKKIRDIK